MINTTPLNDEDKQTKEIMPFQSSQKLASLLGIEHGSDPVFREVTILPYSGSQHRIPESFFDGGTHSIKLSYTSKHEREPIHLDTFIKEQGGRSTLMNVYDSLPQQEQNEIPGGFLGWVEKQTNPHPDIILSEHGLDKYAYIKDVKGGPAIPIRVLSIFYFNQVQGHPSYSSGGASVVIEEVSTNTEKGGRVRVIRELTIEDLPLVYRDKQDSAQSARDAFLDSLNPTEILTLQYALQFGIGLFSYDKTKGFPLLDSIYTNAPGARSAIAHVLEHAFIEKCGPIDDKFLLDHDKGNIHFIDIFSRLDPQVVIDTYGSIIQDYYRVITEDGRLKLCPQGVVLGNLIPQFVRLAGGRRIFDGGELHIDGGTVFIKNYSVNRAYEKNNYNFNSHTNHRAKDFIRATFKERIPGSHTSFSEKFFDDGSDHSDSFSTFDKKTIITEWDITKNDLLNYQDRCIHSNCNSSSHAERYRAYYVLQVDNRTSFEIIKKQYKKLMTHFHPDNITTGNTQTAQLIVLAIEILEKIQNSYKEEK